MNDVRLPIETNREGDKITKVCVEDIYKIVARIENALDKAYEDSSEILEDVKSRNYWTDNPEPNTVWEGCLIVGTGVSQPCHEDMFNERIGNDVAFMKAKLNANIKKHNILCRIWNNLSVALDKIDEDLEKVDKYIELDLNGIRNYNPDYLKGLELKLGL